MANDLDAGPAEIGAAGNFNITTGAPGTAVFGGFGAGRGASYYYPNIELSPGDLSVKPPIVSAQREVAYGRKAAVKAGRALMRQNEHIRAAFTKRTNMVVGSSLRVMPQPNWKLLLAAAPAMFPDEETARKWAKDFAGQCYQQFNDWGYGNRLLNDAEGHYNFGGQMWLAFQDYSGPNAESVGVIHYDQDRADQFKSRWATYVSLIDPDRLETPADLAGDPTVVDGRLIAPGRGMIALYIANGHPSDGGMNAIEYTLCPRENAMGRAMAWHYFEKTRNGAQRGLTKLITVMRASGMFDQFDDAHLGNAVKSASLATYIQTMASPETIAAQLAPAANNGPSAWDVKLNYYSRTKVRFGNQKLPIMPPGDKVVMDGLTQALADPSAFRNGFLRAFASATGLSFEQLSNNYSEANYSSARAALLEVWRGIIADRTLFTSHVGSPIYAAVIEEAIAKGRIVLPPGAPDFYEFMDAYTNCSWTGPGMGWIDPQKEAAAQSVRLANKTTTRQQEIAQQGGDWSEVFEQLHEEDQLAEQLGISLTPPQSVNVAGNPDLPGADEQDDPANNPDQPPKRQTIKKGSAS